MATSATSCITFTLVETIKKIFCWKVRVFLSDRTKHSFLHLVWLFDTQQLCLLFQFYISRKNWDILVYLMFDVGWITLFNRHNMKWMLKKYGTIRPIADADRTNYRLLDTKWPKYIFLRSDPGFVGSKLDGDIIYNDWLNGKCV